MEDGLKEQITAIPDHVSTGIVWRCASQILRVPVNNVQSQVGAVFDETYFSPA